MTHTRRKFWIESWVAAASGLLSVITLIRQDWVELIFRVDPDHGNGALEWAIAGGLLTVCLLAAALARVERRQGPTLTATE